MLHLSQKLQKIKASNDVDHSSVATSFGNSSTSFAKIEL